MTHDRRVDLVFIGDAEKMDEAKIRAKIDDALLTQEELCLLRTMTLSLSLSLSLSRSRARTYSANKSGISIRQIPPDDSGSIDDCPE